MILVVWKTPWWQFRWYCRAGILNLTRTIRTRTIAVSGRRCESPGRLLQSISEAQAEPKAEDYKHYNAQNTPPPDTAASRGRERMVIVKGARSSGISYILGSGTGRVRWRHDYRRRGAPGFLAILESCSGGSSCFFGASRPSKSEPRPRIGAASTRGNKKRISWNRS